MISMCYIKSLTNFDGEGPLESPYPTSSLKHIQLHHIAQGSEPQPRMEIGSTTGLPGPTTNCSQPLEFSFPLAADL